MLLALSQACHVEYQFSRSVLTMKYGASIFQFEALSDRKLFKKLSPLSLIIYATFYLKISLGLCPNAHVKQYFIFRNFQGEGRINYQTYSFMLLAKALRDILSPLLTSHSSLEISIMKSFWL